MRRLALSAIVFACAVTPALAQPAPQEPAKAPAATPPSHNPDADAALAMTIRQRAEQDARIAAIACQAGDVSKCATSAATGQSADSSAAAKAPKPS